jgi:sterol desaturase/sphingolipid hydroxylase (fatty acid hydroxylase superfamily)
MFEANTKNLRRFWIPFLLLASVLFFLVCLLPYGPLRGLLNIREIKLSFFAVITVLLIEILTGGWKNGSAYKMMFQFDHSQSIDLIMFLLHITGMIGIFVIVFSLGISSLLGSAARVFTYYVMALHLRLDTGYLGANFAIYYLLYSFIEYWSHRLFHTGPFWHLHRLHHSATSLNPLVMHRAHPANLFLNPLTLALPLMFVATPWWSPVALGVCNTFYQMLVHSSVPWTWGWFGKWILISPAAHRIHHSANPLHYGKNLSVLVVWDHIFGTWYRGGLPVERVGIVDGNYTSGRLFLACWYDVRAFFATAYLRYIPSNEITNSVPRE